MLGGVWTMNLPILISTPQATRPLSPIYIKILTIYKRTIINKKYVTIFQLKKLVLVLFPLLISKSWGEKIKFQKQLYVLDLKSVRVCMVATIEKLLVKVQIIIYYS